VLQDAQIDICRPVVSREVFIGKWLVVAQPANGAFLLARNVPVDWNPVRVPDLLHQCENLLQRGICTKSLLKAALHLQE
jgi:hypothetical protein